MNTIKKIVSFLLLSVMMFSFVPLDKVNADEISPKAVACPVYGSSHRYTAASTWTNYNTYIGSHRYKVDGVYLSCKMYGDVTYTEYKCACGSSYSKVTNTHVDCINHLLLNKRRI